MIPSLRESCGVMGIFAPGEDVARLTFFGLHSLQHRGQESAGIATANGEPRIQRFAEMGLVTQIFHEDVLSGLGGTHAIGHTRYSTTGSSTSANMQPLIVSGPQGELALAHNGNVVNADLLRRDLVERGVEFSTGTDSEVLAHLLATAPEITWQQRFNYVMRRASGAYSLTLLTPDALFGVRDPLGIRPLCLGRLGDGWVLASETCALDTLGADFVREVEPGEVVRIDEAGVQSWIFAGERPAEPALCLLEHIYFARPDSKLQGERVYPVRMRMGAQLAREHPAEGDVVIGIPDSATAAAVGYAQESGIPYVEGLVKNRYVGRTFIQPDQRLRDRGVELKFNPLPELLERPARRRCRRHDRARHHDAARRGDAAQGRCARGAHAHHLAPDHAPLLLRRRHGDARRTDRRAPRDRGDPQAHRRRHARLPFARGDGRRDRPGAGRALRSLLHRRVPERGAAATGQVRPRGRGRLRSPRGPVARRPLSMRDGP